MEVFACLQETCRRRTWVGTTVRHLGLMDQDLHMVMDLDPGKICFYMVKVKLKNFSNLF